VEGRLDGRALVTGGGRGIGANVARELAAAGMAVVVTGRTRGEIDAVAAETGGQAIAMDVASQESVERGFAEAGPVDLLVANAGTNHRESSWTSDPARWWRTFEVNVLGVHLCCRAVIPGMLERGAGRIVIVGSGAAYLPGTNVTAYPASKAAVCRYGETLNAELEGRIPVFVISPGLVRTAMTEEAFGDDAPWTPPECAPRLVRALASGEFDALAGRYLHAEHDPPKSLRGRAAEILDADLNAIRLRR
jgi:3-oxoacyl-[acyl-carrier protein] reductase